MVRFSVVCSIAVFVGSVAPAAVIYEPVQSQYQTSSGRVFYYGGSREDVSALAQRVDCLRGLTRGYVRSGVVNQPDEVFTDCLPYVNAAIFDYTPVDARNDAYANVPRYFRKAAMLAGAPVTPDGDVIVPPQQPAAVKIKTRPIVPRTEQATPATQPTEPLLIHPGAGVHGHLVVDAR